MWHRSTDRPPWFISFEYHECWRLQNAVSMEVTLCSVLWCHVVPCHDRRTRLSLAHFLRARMMYSTWRFPEFCSRSTTSLSVSLEHKQDMWGNQIRSRMQHLSRFFNLDITGPQTGHRRLAELYEIHEVQTLHVYWWNSYKTSQEDETYTDSLFASISWKTPTHAPLLPSQ